MVVIRGFEFSLRELAGSVGDFGTLFPFIIGYILFCGFEPTGILVGIGITNIFLAFVYQLPLPVQPKKVIGSIAIAEKWSMNRVLGGGFAVGCVWIILALSKKVSHFLEKIPRSIVGGIQLGLAFKLALSGAKMLYQNLLLGIPLILVAFLLLRIKFFPTSLFLVLSGFIYAIFSGNLKLNTILFSFSLPVFHLFAFDDLIYGFVYAGFAQLFLTLTNAVIATVALLHDYFPDRKDVTSRGLIANMAFMNVLSPFIGGIPLCHGAGGLAAQHLFGARTGGAILMEGIIEILLGLFMSKSLLSIFTSFPQFVVGVMIILVSLELGKVSLKPKERKEIIVILATSLISAILNVAIGFFMGILVYSVLNKKRN